MAIIAKNTSNYKPAPAGLQNLVCIDVVDLGNVDTPYGPKDKVQFIFSTETLRTDGKPYRIFHTLNLNLHEKSNLRKFLAAWLGRELTEDESDGFNLDSLVGKSCAGLLRHAKGRNGKVYANIENVMPTEVMVKPPADYVRVQDSPADEPPKSNVHPAVPDVSKFKGIGGGAALN